MNARPHSRFLAQGHEIKRFQLPRTIPCACHAKRCPARPLVAPFPTPATRNARCVHASPRRPRESTFATPPVATLPHTCHVKRTRTNVQMQVSPHLPRGSTLQCLPERVNASKVPRLTRETHVTVCNIMRACNTPRRQSPWHGAAGMPPRHACGTPAARLRHARSPQPATRNARPPCVHATRPEPNPHGTAPPAARPRHTLRHARHARSPQPATRNDAQRGHRSHHSPRLPRGTVAMHAAPQRERRSEPDSRTGPRFRKPRRCHPAALIEEEILEYHDKT